MESPDNSPPIRRLRLWFLGVLAMATGIFLGLLLATGTHQFWDLGAIMAVVAGAPILILSVAVMTIVFFTVGWIGIRNQLSLKMLRRLLLAPALLVASFWFVLFGHFALPSSRFKMVVSPRPRSVSHIRVAGLDAPLASRWFLTFQIDAKDTADIIVKNALVQTNYLDLQKMTDRDTFYARVSWTKDLQCPTNALFYYRPSDLEKQLPSRWTYFVVDTNTSRAWFTSGYQD